MSCVDYSFVAVFMWIIWNVPIVSDFSCIIINLTVGGFYYSEVVLLQVGQPNRDLNYVFV